MNLYLLIITLVITVSFVYGKSIREECDIVKGFGGIKYITDDCCYNDGITCDNDGHITEM